MTTITCGGGSGGGGGCGGGREGSGATVASECAQAFKVVLTVALLFQVEIVQRLVLLGVFLDMHVREKGHRRIVSRSRGGENGAVLLTVALVLVGAKEREKRRSMRVRGRGVGVARDDVEVAAAASSAAGSANRTIIVVQRITATTVLVTLLLLLLLLLVMVVVMVMVVVLATSNRLTRGLGQRRAGRQWQCHRFVCGCDKERWQSSTRLINAEAFVGGRERRLGKGVERGGWGSITLRGGFGHCTNWKR